MRAWKNGWLKAHHTRSSIFPRRGRPGKKEGTRELVLSPLPYVVVYRISDEVIQLVRILHGSQNCLAD